MRAEFSAILESNGLQYCFATSIMEKEEIINVSSTRDLISKFNSILILVNCRIEIAYGCQSTLVKEIAAVSMPA
jgi:hypothetical protein